jgi:ribosomal protein L2
MELGNFYLGFHLNYEKKSNYSTFLYTFPSGTFIHHIAAKSNSYGLFARAAGTCGFIYAK